MWTCTAGKAFTVTDCSTPTITRPAHQLTFDLHQESPYHSLHCSWRFTHKCSCSVCHTFNFSIPKVVHPPCLPTIISGLEAVANLHHRFVQWVSRRKTLPDALRTQNTKGVKPLVLALELARDRSSYEAPISVPTADRSDPFREVLRNLNQKLKPLPTE